MTVKRRVRCILMEIFVPYKVEINSGAINGTEHC